MKYLVFGEKYLVFCTLCTVTVEGEPPGEKVFLGATVAQLLIATAMRARIGLGGAKLQKRKRRGGVVN